MSNTQSKVWIQSGKISRSKIGPSAYVLLHGGAGPQDPQGDAYRRGQHFLTILLNELHPHPPVEINSELKSRWSELSLASRLCINAVRGMESEPLLNSGFGASLQSDGVARVSASFMESRQKKFSAVINAKNLEHPSELALFLQQETFSILDSFGAKELSQRLGIPSRNLVTKERLQKWVEFKKKNLSGRTSTVGSIAFDKHKNLAVMTSTGGVGNETPGRVGDTPTIAGNYCSQKVAVSCTGIGEQIISHAVAPRLAVLFEQEKSLKKVAEETFFAAAEQGHSFAAIAMAFHSETDELEWVAASSLCHLLWSEKTITVVSK